MTDEEVVYFLDAVRELIENIEKYKKEYIYVPKRNEYIHRTEIDSKRDQLILEAWFSLENR